MHAELGGGAVGALDLPSGRFEGCEVFATQRIVVVAADGRAIAACYSVLLQALRFEAATRATATR